MTFKILKYTAKCKFRDENDSIFQRNQLELPVSLIPDHTCPHSVGIFLLFRIRESVKSTLLTFICMITVCCEAVDYFELEFISKFAS